MCQEKQSQGTKLSKPPKCTLQWLEVGGPDPSCDARCTPACHANGHIAPSAPQFPHLSWEGITTFLAS